MSEFEDLVSGSGRGSWYSQAPGWVDLEDRPGSNALGVPDFQQGIALPSRKTLGKWFDVTFPNGQVYRLQQTDIGPGKSTGRNIDISAAAARAAGYTPRTFPTDQGKFSWTLAEGEKFEDLRPTAALGQKYRDLPFSERFGNWPSSDPKKMNQLFKREERENRSGRAFAFGVPEIKLWTEPFRPL